jgi:hypothetical protein
MHTWTVSFIILNSHIFATYMMIIPCFTLIYGDLPMIPFTWFITLQNMNSLFCVFSHSETYTGSNWPRIFGALFFHWEKPLGPGTTHVEAWAPKEHTGSNWPPTLAFSLMALDYSSLIPLSLQLHFTSMLSTAPACFDCASWSHP